MITKQLLVVLGATALLAGPAMAQTTTKEQNGHHYNGGPKTEVPHHMGAKETTGTATNTAKSPTGSHHYNGGPKSEVPHHMGAK